jgi:hypothetical protein
MFSVPMPDMRHIILPGFAVTAARLEFDGLCDACCPQPIYKRDD